MTFTRALLLVCFMLLPAFFGGFAALRTAYYPSAAGLEAEGWRLLPSSPPARGIRVRAEQALSGFLTPPAGSIILLLAERDSGGEALDSSCVYRLEGNDDLPARWWSLTVYGSASTGGEEAYARRPLSGALVSTPHHANAFTRTLYREMGKGVSMPRYSLTLARSMAHGPWLALPSEGEGKGFSVVLRLYAPEPEFLPALMESAADRPMAALPVINREMCAGL